MNSKLLSATGSVVISAGSTTTKATAIGELKAKLAELAPKHGMLEVEDKIELGRLTARFLEANTSPEEYAKAAGWVLARFQPSAAVSPQVQRVVAAVTSMIAEVGFYDGGINYGYGEGVDRYARLLERLSGGGASIQDGRRVQSFVNLDSKEFARAAEPSERAAMSAKYGAARVELAASVQDLLRAQGLARTVLETLRDAWRS
ncbi:MAG: hypothetical protein IT384_08885 [Deltaproteobacteria bacterium]|nr:hypothetical protein [Deltaproteobacteria bacterium]